MQMAITAIHKDSTEEMVPPYLAPRAVAGMRSPRLQAAGPPAAPRLWRRPPRAARTAPPGRAHCGLPTTRQVAAPQPSRGPAPLQPAFLVSCPKQIQIP